MTDTVRVIYSPTPRTIDHPDTRCVFDSRGCSDRANGHGGFDVHHPLPISMGGTQDQPGQDPICPSHHARQHSLLRYLVEAHVPAWSVLIHFTPAEIKMAKYAVEQWKAAGSPVIAGWSRPAAR